MVSAKTAAGWRIGRALPVAGSAVLSGSGDAPGEGRLTCLSGACLTVAAFNVSAAES